MQPSDFPDKVIDDHGGFFPLGRVYDPILIIKGQHKPPL